MIDVLQRDMTQILLKKKKGVPAVAKKKKNPTSILEDKGSIPGPTPWVKDLAMTWAVV